MNRIAIVCFVVFASTAFIAPPGGFARPLPQGGGTVAGKVIFSGTPPKNKEWKATKNSNICGHTKPLDRIIVDKRGGVANAVVILKGASGSTAALGSKFTIDQKNCHYTPHIVIVPRGGTLSILNSDDVLHNTHGHYLADHSTAYNIAQPIQNQNTPVTLRKPGFIEMECDAGHTWMSAWVYVAETPYVAVTGKDGSFSLKNVPPGTYTIECWHEGWNITGDQAGRPIFGAPQTQDQTVTVTAGGEARVQFQLHD